MNFVDKLAVLLAFVSETVGVNCPSGKFDGVFGCEPCPKGTYKVNEGPGPCTRCSGELITSQIGSASSDKCYQPCPEGQYVNKESQCQPCPKNTYRNASMEKCVTCGDGLVTVGKGATSITECVQCKHGTYRHWIICTTCPDDPTETCCKRRAEGDLVSEKSCEPDCPQIHSNYTWSDSCQPCPLNTYKEEGDIACKPCPNGRVTKTIGAYNASECIENVNTGKDGMDNLRRDNNIQMALLISFGGIVIFVLTLILWKTIQSLNPKHRKDSKDLDDVNVIKDNHALVFNKKANSVRMGKSCMSAHLSFP